MPLMDEFLAQKGLNVQWFSLVGDEGAQELNCHFAFVQRILLSF